MVLQIENRTSETFLIFCVPFRLYYFQKIVYTGMQSFLNCLIKGLEFSYIFISLFLVRVLTGIFPLTKIIMCTVTLGNVIRFSLAVFFHI